MSPAKAYAGWIGWDSSSGLLRESGAPPELLLQAIWQQQRLLRDQLTTMDGRAVQVLHPGFWNREAGPDFHGALIRIGDESPVSGDIEIDVEFAGWRAHGHDRNPNFARVVLHVVWDAEPGDRSLRASLPQLALKPFLDAPITELSKTLSGDAGQLLPEELSGKCLAPLKALNGEAVVELLKQGARCRLTMKAAQFEARARKAGWDQALWEGLFRGLGYKQNAWPMQRLAELLPRLGFDLVAKPESAKAWQGRLLGVSGLLPTDVRAGSSNGTEEYLKRIWDSWWRERDQYADLILPRSIWRFSGQRPANHPQRRLALAAHWLSRPDLIPKVIDWFSSPIRDGRLIPSLLAVLKARRDEFWESRWTLKSQPMANPQPLLGETRVTDLAMNVILPWFWSRCANGGSQDLQKMAESRYFAWPKAQDNAVLRLARQRLLGGAHSRSLKTAAVQQGLLQVVRDFCCHSNAVCEDCRFPRLVRSLGGTGRESDSC